MFPWSFFFIFVYSIQLVERFYDPLAGDIYVAVLVDLFGILSDDNFLARR